jgi:mRNA interferase HigB
MHFSSPHGESEDHVHILTHRKIVDFAAKHPNVASALDSWYRTMKASTFTDFVEIRAIFPATDLIKENVFVFNIGGNAARLVAAIHFNRQMIFILAILTHAEYNKDKWK